MCPFCLPAELDVFYEQPLVFAAWDRFPVAHGHALVITRRHVPTWFEATLEEQTALLAAVEQCRREIVRRHGPQGFNLGVNIGAAGGQTVPHLHLHVIARYAGDVPDPRGGVRHVIPHKGNYLAAAPPAVTPPPAATHSPSSLASSLAAASIAPPASAPPPERSAPPLSSLPAPLSAAASPALIAGGIEDPLLPHLLRGLGQARQVDLAVAFVLPSGVRLLWEHLVDLVARPGGRLRLVTTDYLDATDPDALSTLCDLGPGVELYAYRAEFGAYHPKTYIFHQEPGRGLAVVGSSNLTQTALERGVEWNFRVVEEAHSAGFQDVAQAFERLLASPHVAPIDEAWIAAYRQRRRVPTLPPTAPPTHSPQQPSAPIGPPAAASLPAAVPPAVAADAAAIPTEPPAPLPEPHPVQQAALAALEATRAAGNEAGLVVLATGLGKTWLAAFDAGRPDFRRVLFVAHREEILTQALHTFRQIRPDARLGRFTGQEKTPDVDVLFASIQTLSRVRHLETFARDAFDYMVVDEFHHADAATYRRVIDYFTPRFLLGLTATPDRTDGGDLLALCGQNLVYAADLVEGIEAGLLCPFAYFGVPDEVDYRNIPWRSARFSEEELTAAVATQRRAQNAFEQWQRHSPRRTLGFCCSVRHADFMAEFFRECGVRAMAVHSGQGSSSRAEALDALQRGELQALFAVDMFNEGLDVPQLDAVLMLRPTESTIVWLQQFGRGLRRAEGKERLTVIDYIGNHRSFLMNASALFGALANAKDHEQVLSAFRRVKEGGFALPPGCEITYDLGVINGLEKLLGAEVRKGRGPQAVKQFISQFVQRHERRPTATELHQAGYVLSKTRQAHGSWFGLLHALELLTPEETACFALFEHFLTQLEITRFTRCYKGLTLLAMLHLDALPGRVAIADLSLEFARLAGRSSELRADVSVPLEDLSGVERLVRENPINAWCDCLGDRGDPYFAVDGHEFQSTFSVPMDQRRTFQSMVREICDYRIAAYLSKAKEAPSDFDDVSRIVCKIIQSNDRPILKLPDRQRQPSIPTGWIPIKANYESYLANFVKFFVNVVRRDDGSEQNVLGDLVRGWFGPDAGQPSTNFHVVFDQDEGIWHLRPELRGNSHGQAS